MKIFLGILLVLAVAGAGYLAVRWLLERRAARRIAAESARLRVEAEARERELEARVAELRSSVARLAKWSDMADAEDAAKRMLHEAQSTLAQAEDDSRILITNVEEQARRLTDDARAEASKIAADAKAKATELTEAARLALATASDQSIQIMADANRKAEEIGGKAFDALRNADLYERTIRAMRNTIQGYGDEYLKPAESLDKATFLL